MKIPDSFKPYMRWFPTTMGILFIATAVTYLVYKSAWISDDAFITLRYVTNTIDGYGPVFNPGDFVQGYTHPMWFILLILISFVFPDPILNAINLGLILTICTFLLMGFTFYTLTRKSLPSLVFLTLGGILFVLSDPWISFQTSGLENSLSHFILATLLAIISLKGLSRPGWLVFFMGLLCLSRPDFIVLVLPTVVFLVAVNLRKPKTFFRMVLALTPTFTWLIFSWFFYDDIIPNTAHAKIGIYPSWVESANQGFVYLKDWIKYDTLAAGFTLFFWLYVLMYKKSLLWRTILFGILLYSIWIIWIGGDFMRGRLFLPVFFTSVLLGLITINLKIKTKDLRISTGLVIPLVIFSLLYGIQQIPPDPGREISDDGIVDERVFYPDYSLVYYKQHNRVKNPYLDLDFAIELRKFAERCGPITIHSNNPGTLGYIAGPDVCIIDSLGLTDSYIAKLPNDHLVETHPRPGHPIKHIPIDYLISKHDISLMAGWERYIYNRDCSIVEGSKP